MKSTTICSCRGGVGSEIEIHRGVFPEYCSQTNKQTNKRRNLSVAAASIASIAGGGGGPVTKPKYLPTFGEIQIFWAEIHKCCGNKNNVEDVNT